MDDLVRDLLATVGEQGKADVVARVVFKGDVTKDAAMGKAICEIEPVRTIDLDGLGDTVRPGVGKDADVPDVHGVVEVFEGEPAGLFCGGFDSEGDADMERLGRGDADGGRV